MRLEGLKWVEGCAKSPIETKQSLAKAHGALLPPLCKALHDSDPAVREAALGCLAEVCRKAGTLSIVDKYAKEIDEAKRKQLEQRVLGDTAAAAAPPARPATSAAARPTTRASAAAGSATSSGRAASSPSRSPGYSKRTQSAAAAAPLRSSTVGRPGTTKRPSTAAAAAAQDDDDAVPQAGTHVPSSQQRRRRQGRDSAAAPVSLPEAPVTAPEPACCPALPTCPALLCSSGPCGNQGGGGGPGGRAPRGAPAGHAEEHQLEGRRRRPPVLRNLIWGKGEGDLPLVPCTCPVRPDGKRPCPLLPNPSEPTRPQLTALLPLCCRRGWRACSSSSLPSAAQRARWLRLGPRPWWCSWDLSVPAGGRRTSR